MKNESSTEFQIELEEKTTRTVEIKLPAYKKVGYRFYKILSKEHSICICDMEGAEAIYLMCTEHIFSDNKLEDIDKKEFDAAFAKTSIQISNLVNSID